VSTHGFKIAFSVLWGGLLVAAAVVWLGSDVEIVEVPALVHDWLVQFGLARAGLLYVVLYTIRPLVFFPALVLTIASGMVFGPGLGILLTVIGENASANLAFSISRWLGRDWVSAHEHGRILVWDAKIRNNAIVSVLVMRLIYLPFDAVNYGCGLTAMRHRDFFIGTLIGIMPGLVSFVLLGGSGGVGVENRLALLVSAVFFFFLGLVVAHFLRRSVPTPQSVAEIPVSGS